MRHLTYDGCYAAFYGTGPPVQVPFVERLALSFDLAADLLLLTSGVALGVSSRRWHVVGMGRRVENLAEARRS